MTVRLYGTGCTKCGKKKKKAHVSSLGNNQSRCSTAVTKGGKGFCFSVSAGSNVPNDGFKLFNARLNKLKKTALTRITFF